MNIQITQNQIEEAIINYLITQGINTQGKDIDLKIKSGRKGNGITATIILTDTSTKKEPEQLEMEFFGEENLPEAVEETSETDTSSPSETSLFSV